MSIQKRSPSNKLAKYTLYGLSFIGALILLSVLSIFLSFFGPSKQISTADANKICSDFQAQIVSDISNISGYSVEHVTKNCSPEEDEANNTDYLLSVNAVVASAGLDSETTITRSMQQLADNLPMRNYPVFLDNTPPVNGQSNICLFVTRYLDNDGKDVPQGTPDHTVHYEPTGRTNGKAACEGI